MAHRAVRIPILDLYFSCLLDAWPSCPRLRLSHTVRQPMYITRNKYVGAPPSPVVCSYIAFELHVKQLHRRSLYLELCYHGWLSTMRCAIYVIVITVSFSSSEARHYVQGTAIVTSHPHGKLGCISRTCSIPTDRFEHG